MKVGDLGEIRLLHDIVLSHVSQEGDHKGDDCAHLSVGGEELLWSIDPCPTPVAKWFGLDKPEVYGWYTALINLSDIAASGGTPLGMLVSMEFPDETHVAFVEGFQRGLRSALSLFDAKIFGGNLKSASSFSATGSILGIVKGNRSICRRIKSTQAFIYLIGNSGLFWSSIIAHRTHSSILSTRRERELVNALCFPIPQVEAGKKLSNLPYKVACMDCSDGVLNSMQQLATACEMNITLDENVAKLLPGDLKELLLMNGIRPENAVLQFGDWQLLCLVPTEHSRHFEESLKGFSIQKMGVAYAGDGSVRDETGRSVNPTALNENFSGGYNSIKSLDELIEKFMFEELFI